ncbi:MAG: thioredoxin domain-containing protein [Crocinitomicaceae bacterium]
MSDKEPKYTNSLINESSPYLLQHAHNPVDWMPWGDEAFEKAKKENKLVLISIGYSSCHWCHVMEHESFENEAVAKVMNDHFVCIKVDREERPDVDQVYMNAVQLMTKQGGWPLNCFTLPNGKPIYGGTYFPAAKWVDVLEKLDETYQADSAKVIDYANKLTDGIQSTELISVKEEVGEFSVDRLHETVQNWKINLDHFRGGPNRAPKFPLPNNYEFLMHYAHEFGDSSLMEHVDLTLEKMAFGGIYDQVGGGFARYSVDAEWKVPHFEKMLYDNAQLISLYSKAYQRTKNPLYKHIVEQTIGWAEREMLTDYGCFYSALDADSEGEEGKFYVWSKAELKTLLEDDYALIDRYYNLNQKGAWEGNQILQRSENDATIADEFEMSISELNLKIDAINALLLEKRSSRIRPGLDDKSLTSWNALMGIAYTDAYQAFGKDSYLNRAKDLAAWVNKEQLKQDELWHTFKNGTSKISGFLEDYAITSYFFVKLYEVTFNEDHLQTAKLLTEKAIADFEDQNSGMFYFTSKQSHDLVARKMDVSDNVIPASNSIFARNLFELGTILYNQDYISRSKQMLANMYDTIPSYGSGYSNWAMLCLNMTTPYYEIAITGKETEAKFKQLCTHYIPNKVLMGCHDEKTNIPLLQGKFTDETTIYVCVNQTCQLPSKTVDDALKQIK